MGPSTGEMGAHFEAEMEINDFPQHARWKVRAPGHTRQPGCCPALCQLGC